MIYALSNTKGGVGKTTLLVHLACYLASKKRRVLVVDADRQGSASAWLAALNVAGLEVVAAPKERAIVNAIDEAKADDIVIDCAGTDDSLHRVPMLLADTVVMPTGGGALDLRALASSVELLAEARKIRRSKKPDGLVVLNRFDSRTLIARDALAIVHGLDIAIVRTTIGQRVAVSEAPGQRRLVWDVPGQAGDELRGACADIVARRVMPTDATITETTA